MLQKHLFHLIVAIAIFATFAEAGRREQSNCTYRSDPTFDRIYANPQEPIDYIPPDLICVRSTYSEFRQELRDHKDQIDDIKCDTCGIDDLDIIHEVKDLKDVRSINWVNQTLKPNFRKLENIQQIYLKENDLDITDQLFTHNPKLRIVHIYLNYVQKLPENIFANNPNLRVVVISRCKIRQIPSGLFRNQDLLEVVNLRQNHISELPNELFASKPKLTILNLSYNRIMSIEPKFVEHLKNLKELHLTGNPIYEIAIEPIFKLDLDIFRIDYLPCDTLKNKLLPFCKFKRQCEWDECEWEEDRCLYYKPDPKGEKRIALTQVSTDETDILKDQWIESHVDGIVCINYCGTDLKHVPDTVDYPHLMNLVDALETTLNQMLEKNVFVVPALAAKEELQEIKLLL